MKRKLAALVVACAVLAVWLARGGRTDDKPRDAAAGSAELAPDDPSAIMMSAARTASLLRLRVPAVKPIVPGALRLEGLVTDPDDRPVAAARVSIGEGRTAVTESDGSFAFDGLAEGEYDLVAEADGAFVEVQGQRLDDTSDPVTLQLARGPTLVVHVIDEAKHPIVGAKVEIVGRDKYTGADGTVRLRSVGIDSESVDVSAPGYAAHRERVTTSDDPAVTIDKTFVLRAGAEIAGTVVDAAGKPVDQAYVELENVGGRGTETVYTDAAGAWHIPDIGRGRYVARASSAVGIPAADVPVVHDGEHPTTGVALRVEAGGEIAGIVVDTADHPIAEAHVTGDGIGETTGADGRFVAKGLRPGTYTLDTATPQLGGPDRTVVLARGQHVDVKIVLAPSSIAGTVVDEHGAPVEDASVMARGEGTGLGYGVSDAYGHFDLGGLPPGTYKVTAQRHESRVETAELIVAAGNRQVRLTVPDVAQLTGRVVLAGAPVTYFGFAVLDKPSALYETPKPVRDPDGRFVEKDAKLGTVAVAIVGPGFARKVIENVTIRSGQVTDLGDIAVEAGDALRGRVTDERGAVVAGATVRVVTAHGGFDDADLAAFLEGTPYAVSDARGEFAIYGAPPPGDTPRRVQATHPRLGASQVVEVAGEGALELVIARTGNIDGTIVHRSADVTMISAERADGQPDRYYAETDADDQFHFTGLPAGEYWIDIMARASVPRQQVTVVGGATTAVRFEQAEHAVVVRVRGLDPCGRTVLRDPATDERMSAALCADGVATFETVAPGAYRLCVTFDVCRDVTVPEQPEYEIAWTPP